MTNLQTFRCRVMGGPCEIQVESGSLADQQIEAAVAEIKRIEAKYSRYTESSVVSEINRLAGKKKPRLIGKL